MRLQNSLSAPMYYWSSIYNSGAFDYWKVKNEEELLCKAKKLYGDKKFDFGVTIRDAFERYEKYPNIE